MNLVEFCRSLKLRSDSSLRDSLEVTDWPVMESAISQDYAPTPYKAFNRLIAEVEVIKEILCRLFDEFKGHQNVCRMDFIRENLHEEMKKFTKGFSYTPGPKLGDVLKQAKQIKKELKMDKQIKKVEKDVKKGAKGKAMKDIKTLKSMDKKFDKKINKAKKVMKKKGC